jgi:type IV secretion system protein VirB9
VRRLALALALLAGPAMAEITPRAGEGDPHLQTVGYDAAEVVALHVTAGFALTVQFAPDERIETVTVGDPGAWGVQANKRADRLVVKPAGLPSPTNMTVFTDQRTYNFTLYGTPPGLGVQPYLVSFTYPAAPPPAKVAAETGAGTYRLKGAKALWPLAIGDDGHFTTIRWADDVTLPAVYRQTGPHESALVNGAMKDGAYVLDGVYPALTFVLGKARATALRQEGGQ